jgi:hypothetical protein
MNILYTWLWNTSVILNMILGAEQMWWTWLLRHSKGSK